ncbi:MAG: type II toxin-antitoxin system RelE/ParE family toxin [Thermoplasmata archaeon]
MRLSYQILLSETATKQLRRLDEAQREKIVNRLGELSKDPLRPRSGVDIKRLVGTKPLKHRLRVGAYRVVYLIEETDVKVIEVFRRGRDYR